MVCGPKDFVMQFLSNLWSRSDFDFIFFENGLILCCYLQWWFDAFGCSDSDVLVGNKIMCWFLVHPKWVFHVITRNYFLFIQNSLWTGFCVVSFMESSLWWFSAHLKPRILWIGLTECFTWGLWNGLICFPASMEWFDLFSFLQVKALSLKMIYIWHSMYLGLEFKRYDKSRSLISISKFRDKFVFPSASFVLSRNA